MAKYKITGFDAYGQPVTEFIDFTPRNFWGRLWDRITFRYRVRKISSISIRSDA